MLHSTDKTAPVKVERNPLPKRHPLHKQFEMSRRLQRVINSQYELVEEYPNNVEFARMLNLLLQQQTQILLELIAELEKEVANA